MPRSEKAPRTQARGFALVGSGALGVEETSSSTAQALHCSQRCVWWRARFLTACPPSGAHKHILRLRVLCISMRWRTRACARARSHTFRSKTPREAKGALPSREGCAHRSRPLVPPPSWIAVPAFVPSPPTAGHTNRPRLEHGGNRITTRRHIWHIYSVGGPSVDCPCTTPSSVCGPVHLTLPSVKRLPWVAFAPGVSLEQRTFCGGLSLPTLCLPCAGCLGPRRAHPRWLNSWGCSGPSASLGVDAKYAA